jgi:AcrR family transcriptional regulator
MQPVKRKWTRSPQREAQYESERKAIVRAAYRLIGRAGNSVSVQEILDDAGLSTRAFYRHFASKDELVLSMYRTDNERVASALWAATKAEADPWDGLRAWVELSLSVAFDEGRESHSRVLGSNEARSAPGWNREFLDGVERSLSSLEAVIERGVREGRFVTPSPTDDAKILFGATQNFVSLRMARGPSAMSRDETTNALIQAARRMLGLAGTVAGNGPSSKRTAKVRSVS